jgi:phospholipase/carboxylesterase
MKNLSLHHVIREPLRRSAGLPPALVLLHGVGSNEKDLLGLASALDDRFFVASVRAPIVMGPTSFGWYHVEFTPGGGYIINEAEAVASRGLVLQFVRELKESYSIDPNRVYVMGFSQGCILSLGAALKEPRSFAGVVGMSGRLLDSLLEDTAPASDLKGLPIMVVHGTQDTVIPVEHGRAIRELLSRLPVELTYREYRTAHNVTAESMSDIAGWLSEKLDSAADWRTAGA